MRRLNVPIVVAILIGAAAVLLLVGEGFPLVIAVLLACPLPILVVVDELRPDGADSRARAESGDAGRSGRHLQHAQ
jgi:hypothetical protein